MTFKVLLTARAARDFEQAARWWAEHRSTTQAECCWYNEFLQRLVTLERNPKRCPLACENGRFAYEFRPLAFGRGRGFTHRALYTIRDDSVVILTVRHAAQEDVSRDEIN
jgi:plasmid stabilization system protein ParE